MLTITKHQIIQNKLVVLIYNANSYSELSSAMKYYD